MLIPIDLPDPDTTRPATPWRHDTAPTSTRRLADLVAGLDEGHIHLADTEAVGQTLAGGENPVLYHAHRDILAPRTTDACGDKLTWFADLVTFPAARPLPGPSGELCRSLGHWNSPAQLEIFHCLAGHVLMLHTSASHLGDSRLDYQVCGPGDHAVVAPGAWHLTVVLAAPAQVFNIYTDLPGRGDGHGHGSRDAALRPDIKYRQAPAPRVSVVTDPDDHARLLVDPGTRLRVPRVRAEPPGWLKDLVRADTLLDLYRDGDDAALARLADHASLAFADHPVVAAKAG